METEGQIPGRVRRRLNPKVRWSVLGLFAVAILYAIAFRHWSDFLRYAGAWSVFLGFSFMFGEGSMYLEEAKGKRATALVVLKLLLPVPLVAVIASPLGVAMYSMAVAAGDGIRWIAFQLVQPGRSPIVLATSAAAAAILLFTFRLRYRCMYGLSEALIGLVVAANQAGAGPGLYLTVLTAGVYLVVRGLDNIHQGWKAKSDPLAEAVVDAASSRFERLSVRLWIIDPPPSREAAEKSLADPD